MKRWGYFIFFLVILVILCIAFPLILDGCKFVGYNTLLFIENSFTISKGIHPLLAWSIIFAVFGLFVGLAKSVSSFHLHKKFYLYSFLGVILFLFLLNKCSNPLKYKSSREYREEMLWSNLNKKNSYATCTSYLDEFPNGKYIPNIKIMQEKALWDSASVFKSSKVWNLYTDKFKNSSRYPQAMRNYDRILWGEISTIYNKEAYTNYLKQFPNGIGSRNAKYKLKNDASANERVIASETGPVISQNQPDIQVDSTINNNETDNTEATLNDVSDRSQITDNLDGNNISQASDANDVNKPVDENKSNSGNGYGKLDLPGGIKYEGYYQNGKPNGIGKEIFQDNSTYSGSYVDGKRDGEFVFTNSDGIKETRFFKFGQRIETSNPSAPINPNLPINNNGLRRNGQGTETFPDGTSLSGNYIDGKRDGDFIYTGKDGKKENQVFKNGIRTK